MTTILNDAFGRTASLNGSTAAPTGGAWSDLLSGHFTGGGAWATNGSTFVAPGSSGEEIGSWKNAAVYGTLEATQQVPFTPTTDGWIVGAILHADADGYPCWIGWASGGSRRICRYDSATDTVSTNILADVADTSIPAGNRTAHTVELRAAANGDLTLWVDGSAVSFGSTINDAALTTPGRPGMLARGVNIDNAVGVDATASGPVITGPNYYYGMISGE